MQTKIKKRTRGRVSKTWAVTVLVAAFLFSLFNINFSVLKKVWADDYYISIAKDTIWRKTDNLVFDKDIYLENGATLTIEPGATIKFKRGNWVPSMFVLEGKIIAQGTEKDPITFTANDPNDNQRFSLFFQNDSEIETSQFRYVNFSHAGLKDSGAPPMSESFIKKALASGSGRGAIYFQSGKAVFENCSFSNNQYADFEINLEIKQGQNQGDFLKIVNSNFEPSGDSAAVLGEVFCPYDYPDLCNNRVILENDWYGDVTGPNWNNNDANGKKVEGNFALKGWRSKELIADPVIIIPGIMGSAEKNGGIGQWVLDPLLHTYDDLAKSLETNGYEKGINLFSFPYDWRNENEITAESLRGKIDEIKEATGISKVDLVAHSMGGLVARSYIEGANFQSDVDELVELGTPNRGAPESYLSWEAGEFGVTFQDKMLKYHIKREAKHSSYNDTYDYIRNRVKSVGQLLPDYDYLYDVASSQILNYPSNYPSNNFLEDINRVENLNKLNQVRLINVIGKVTSDSSTISKIRVVGSSVPNRWEHGMPENFYSYSGDQGLEKNIGDETVPRFSAEDIPALETVELNSNHLSLPSKAQCLILEKLTGKTDCTIVDDWHIPNLLYFNVFSPIDIQVVAPDGKRVGKDFATGKILEEIPGAFYSGYLGSEEYLTIPNPQDGEYKVKTEGTGNGGEYKIEAARISEENNQETQELTAEFSGISEPGVQDETKVMVSAAAVTFGEKDEEAPQVSISTPEAKQYLNNQKVKIVYSATDNVSAPEKIKTETFLDDVKLANLDLDFSLFHLGTHKVKVSAKDEAENEGMAEMEFSLATNANAIIGNIKHYFDLRLIKSEMTAKILINRGMEIKALLNFLEQIKAMPLPSSFKDEAVRIQKTIINYQINGLIWQINFQKKSYLIDPKAAELLIESLNAVRP